MTEFALILPIFMVIVAGLLGFGRVFFYWIEANHVANETARWAVVDRNPYAPTTLQKHAADSATSSSLRQGSDGLHPAPGRQPQPWRSAHGHGREAIHVRPDPQYRHDHDPGLVDHADRELPKRRTPPLGTEAMPVMSACARDERGQVIVLAAVMIPVLPLARRAGHRRRQLVHAQAPAPESRRRRCVRRGRRVWEELEGLRSDRRPGAQGEYRTEDRGRSAAVRGRSGPDRLRRRRPSCCAAREHADREPVEVDVAINSTSYDDNTDYSDDYDGSAGHARRPVLQPPEVPPGVGQHLAGRRTVDGRQGEGARPAVALRRHRSTPSAQRREGAHRDPAGTERT